MARYQRRSTTDDQRGERSSLRQALGQGRPAEAAELLERAVELAPEVAGSRNDLGFAYLQLGRYDQAVTTFGEAIRLDPESGRAYFNLCLALEKLGQREDAVLLQRLKG